MRSPKKIFLSSTCLDLIDLRAEIKTSLEEMGYIVYISEAPDFPVNTKISTYDNCLAVVRQCDIYLLIIHTRYGSPYRGATEIKLPDDFAGEEPSVTVAEYLTALESGLEVRIWVRDFIWSAATNVTTVNATLEPEMLPPSIDPSVFSFIDYIKNHPHEGGSWINQFHSVVDLKASVAHWLNETAYTDTSEFRTAVGEICELLGYEFDRSLMNSLGHKRVLARLRESPFDEQDAIWPIYRKSGNTASWRHLRDIVRDVTDELTRGICDRALVVISSPFDTTVTSNLKNHPLARRIRLITYDDLVSTLIPFTSYLKRIVHDFENFEEFSKPDAVKDPVIDIMRRCDLLQFYVPLRGRCSPSDLYEYVQEWLSTYDANQLTLLGDFGTGKSSFALWLTYQMARQITVEGRRDARIPVFISLRDHIGKVDVREIVVNTLANTYGIRNVNFNSFTKLLDAGRLLIIFDGFDETATKADTGQSLRILRELNSLVRRNAKVILSCRTHYFRTDTEAHTDLGRGLRSKETELFTEQKGRTNFEIVNLKEFDPAQIEEFLNKHFGGDAERTKRTLTTMHATYNLWDLARRPVLLEMILKVFPRLSRKLGRVIITPAELYQEYIEEWIAYVAKGNEELLDSEGKRNFCDNLAQWMYKNNQELLPYSELETLVHEYFTDRPLAAYAALDTEVRTCSFLNRDSVGNYQFVHRSFMEFFIAKAISKELDLSRYELLSVKELSFEVRNFLRGLQLDAVPYLKAIEYTKRQAEETAGWVGANAIAMLGLIGYDFCGHDFSRTVLTGADFTGSDLTDCNFQGANLSRTTFANAKLTRTDFSRADLSHIVIREFRRITCVTWGAERLIVGGEDGSVRVYSSVTWELDSVLRGHDTSVHAVVISPAEQFLFTVSEERLLVWSVDGLSKFAEFSDKDGEVGPISMKYDQYRYEVTILSEHNSFFIPAPMLFRSVDELEVSVRSYNCMKNANIRTIADLASKTQSEMLSLKDFGKKALNELTEIIAQLGLQFGMELPIHTTSSDDRYQVELLEKRVTVRNKVGDLVFESPALEQRPIIASYSARSASLAVGTDDGRVLVWDSNTSAKLADFEQGALDCTGLRLADAKGLEQQAPNARVSLGEWLSSRGAVLIPTQRRKLQHRLNTSKHF